MAGSCDSSWLSFQPMSPMMTSIRPTTAPDQRVREGIMSFILSLKMKKMMPKMSWPVPWPQPQRAPVPHKGGFCLVG